MQVLHEGDREVEDDIVAFRKRERYSRITD